jgi:putative ABC transport system permease protein
VKFLPLLLANLMRKKVRTTLTIGSFAVALFLFGLLAAIRSSFNQGITVAGADRLVVFNRVSIIQFLPFAYRDRILRIPGVGQATYATWFGGVYRDEKNFFPQFAIDHPSWRAVFPEFRLSDAEWHAFETDRAGCIVGAALADRFKWKLGDRIPLRGTIFTGSWELNLRGIYRGERPQDDTGQFWLRADYLEERAPRWFKGNLGWYTVRITDPDRAVAVARAIDESFANSAWETRTQSEKALAASFVKQVGNVEFLILVVGGVVFFTLLLVTGNTMASVVRERTSELAVLKALGFSDGFVLGLVLAESGLIAALGGGTGLILAKIFTDHGDPSGGLLGGFYLEPRVLATGAALALSIGMAAGLLPALSAMRLRVIDALRRL